MTISREVFHSLIFCPAVASALGSEVSSLPGSCGIVGEIESHGLKITSVTTSLASGYIDIDGSFYKSGSCYEAKGTFHGTIKFTVSGMRITPIVTMDKPDIDVDIDWYCLILPFFGGPEMIIFNSILNKITDNIINAMSNSLLESLSNSFKSIGLGSDIGASFDEVEITPEGITLNGIVPLSSLLLKGERSLKINGSVTTTGTEIISSGYYSIPKGCMKGEYPYKEQARQQTGTFQVIHTYLGAPLVLSFRLEYYRGSRLVSSTDLSSTSGIVTLSNVDRYFSVPLPGGSVVTGAVNIGYRIFRDIVHLNNMPHDGNYNIMLVAKATDSAGSIESKIEVEFRGNEVNIEGNYQSQLMTCFLNIAEDRRRRSPISKFSVPWPAVNTSSSPRNY